jgi:thiol-disulfide isomerase/thioredoxin
MNRFGSDGETHRSLVARFIACTAGETRRFRSVRQGIALSLPDGDAHKRIVARNLRVFGTMLLACCTLLPAQAQQQSKSGPKGPPSLLGKPAPSFVVTTLDGKEVSLSNYKGKTLIVNFWATWCGNCKLEMPWLAKLREKYATQGFEVLGIVTDNAPPSKVSVLAEKYGVHYPILMCNHKTAQAYGGLPALPASFFINRRGIIVAVMDGADSEQQIEANIRKALGQ